jgi:hypothetical protein
LQEAVAMAAEQARDGGFGQLGSAGDLEAREFTEAQGEDTGDAQRMNRAGRGLRTGGAVLETGGAFCPEAGQPFEGGADGNTEACSDLSDGLLKIDDAPNHLGSTERGESGLTVAVHAAVVPGEVLISQPHLSKSSPHEQPIGTSQLERLPKIISG